MKIINNNCTLLKFDAWSGARDTKNKIIEEDKVSDFDQLIEDLYPDGISETDLNDMLWFEDDWLFKELGIED